ncbi:MAG: DUF1499 domain-containing protein [Paracoccaceae bacterium]|nr:DUF1499 domain-containing protein [Paracoccaceae bacterium]
MFFYGLVILVLAGLAWIRLAPSNPVDWHVDPQVTANQDLAGGVRRRIPAGDETLSLLHKRILETPRTEVLAGSLDARHITYVTRSQWMGFPDYTTLQVTDGQIELWARLRFGQSDLGVNKARVEGWLAMLESDQGS